MAQEWSAGWEAHQSQDAIERQYRNTVNASILTWVTGRQTGKAVRSASVSLSFQGDTPVLRTRSTYTVGDAWKLDQISGLDPVPLRAFLSGSEVQVTLALDVGGDPEGLKLLVYRGDVATGTLLAETGFDYQKDVWFYLEFQATISPTVGEIEVRVNEVPVAALTATGLNTRGATGNDDIDAVRYHGPAGSFGNGTFMDDGYVNSDFDAGNGDNTGFGGDSLVLGKRPNAFVSGFENWTRSGGSNNYEMVDEEVADDDTTIIISDLNNQEDRYEFEDISEITNDDIRCVFLFTLRRLTLSGTRNYAPRWTRSATTVSGTQVAATGTGWAYDYESHERDPTDGSAWTLANWNAMQIGLRSVA